MRKIVAAKETVFVYNAGGSLTAEYETNFVPATANTKYLTQDHLGSPRAITSQTGAMVSRHDYRAFGEEVYSGTANRTATQGYGKADGVRKQYTGYERDDESGLDFAQARYYNSKLGRFTSVDPLTASANVKDPQTFNRYSYAMNSPYKFTDPLGLLAEKCGLKCRVEGALRKGTGLSEDDLELAKFHIRNGTSLGYSFQQAAREAIRQDDTYTRQVDDEGLKQTDSDLGATFTDSGIVRSVSSTRGKKNPDGSKGDDHYTLANGVAHSMHIFGNKTASSDQANVYVPSGFTKVERTKDGTLLLTNLTTKEVISASHIQYSSLREVRRRMRKVENGRRKIGRIGGRGGVSIYPDGSKHYIHAHLSYFRNRKSWGAATRYKRSQGRLGDYDSSISQHLLDFRTFIK